MGRLAQGEAPELADVFVDMDEFRNQIEANELAVTEAGSFLESPRFQRHYVVRESTSIGHSELTIALLPRARWKGSMPPPEECVYSDALNAVESARWLDTSAGVPLV